jgi:hypothetical protein
VSGPAAPVTVAALERLATALGPGFVTTLVTGAGQRPWLTVARRGGQAAADVYVEAGGFWWGWAEPIGPTADPLAAAHQVSAALAAAPGAPR